ncbi:MAG: DUF4382 domain-containing protein [Gemmatimonadetes bacterium]|nr:DUF4382 domain-containing protein [Gemmatimonadota bacterium]
MTRLHLIRRLQACVLVALGAAACGDSTGTGRATLTVALTDAPDAYFKSVMVEIGEIEIISASGAPTSIVASGGPYDLLMLQNGATASLASLDLEPGTYLQLRLVINSVDVTLADGFSFADGAQSMGVIIPSGAQTGIKINLDGADGDAQSAGVEIRPGETVLVIDFDVSQNFVLLGNPDTGGVINGVVFTPLLRATVLDIAGSIAGNVSVPVGVDPSGITVMAEQTDSGLLEALQTPTATALTDANGNYQIMFLAPGTYDVKVEGQATSLSVTVGDGQDVTAQDFTIQ